MNKRNLNYIPQSDGYNTKNVQEKKTETNFRNLECNSNKNNFNKSNKINTKTISKPVLIVKKLK